MSADDNKDEFETIKRGKDIATTSVDGRKAKKRLPKKKRLALKRRLEADKDECEKERLREEETPEEKMATRRYIHRIVENEYRHKLLVALLASMTPMRRNEFKKQIRQDRLMKKMKRDMENLNLKDPE